MKKRFYAYLLRLIFLGAATFIGLPVANTQTVYFSLAGSALIMITVDESGCTEELVGTIPGNGTAQAIAICGDGQLYFTNNAGEIFLLDIGTMQATLIATLSPGNYITALTCSPNGLLYAGTNNNELLTIDPSSGTVTSLGILPYNPQDLIFYNGALMMSTGGGLVLVDIANPPASTFLFNTPTFSGLSIGHNCGTLVGIASGPSVVEVDIADPSTTPICSGLYYASFDLTSTSEFNPPTCEPMLDLDDDNSSGAPEADFYTDTYSCLTVGGLPIADEDVEVTPISKVATMTINLTGILDAPNEILVLNNAPAGIAIAGSGTQSITLTNVGNVSADAFEQALRLIRYFNSSNPFTPGLRQVMVSFVNTDGQMSNTATAHLWVVELPELVVDLGPDIEICTGESIELDAGNPGSTYHWSNNQTTQTITVIHAGEYSVTVSGLGCPGKDTVKVTVLPILTISLNGTASICAGKTAVLTIFSTYPQPLDVLLSGSDSSQYALTVTGFGTIPLKPTTTTTFTLEVPSLPSNTCFELGNAEITILVYPTDTTFGTASICEGDSIFLAGAWRNAPGVYTQKLISGHGCDSTRITTLQTIPPVATHLNATTCSPAQAGVDTLVLQAFSGCDSLVVTTTTLLPSDTTHIAAYSCDLAETGVFYETLTNAAGCDSLLVTTVNLLATDTTHIAAYSCDPAETGVFYEILTNAAGCDSVLVTTVGLLATDTTHIAAYSCDPAETGVFYEILTNAAGCDSLLVTTVNLLATDTTHIAAYSCDPAETGVFYEILTNAAGCDSVLVTTVGLLATDTTHIAAYSCDLAETGVFYETLTNAAGCDSLLVTTVNLLATDTTHIAAYSCDPAETGVFYEILTNAAGCDSVLVTTVGLLATDTTHIAAYSCDLAGTGVFYEILTNTAGCDSVLVTTVVFVTPDTTLLYVQTCDPVQAGEFVEHWTNSTGCDSTVFTIVTLVASDTVLLFGTSCNPASTGVFYQHLFNAAGCDSTVIRTVTFSQSDTTLIVAKTCDPAQAGVFFQMFTTYEGCDSLVVTTVSLSPSDVLQIHETTCDPGAAGVFVAVLTNQFGCDSTIVTSVQHIPSDTTLLFDTTCDPAQAGVFLYHFVNQYGCDSTVIQTVALLPSDTTYLYLESCDPAQVGMAISTMVNQYGCDSTLVTTTNLYPTAVCVLEIAVTGTILPCSVAAGTLSVYASIGLPPFDFEIWQAGSLLSTGTIGDTGQIAQTAQLPIGTYTVVVTSSSGISATAQASIEPSPLPTIEVVAGSVFGTFEISCQGATDGSAQAMGNGGTAPYTYLWSNGGASSQITNLPAGIYSVTLTDANACTAVGQVELREPQRLEIVLAINEPDCFDFNSGVIIAEAQGGSSPYLFSVNGGAFQNSGTFTGLSAGSYIITVEDANGCETAEALLINAPILVNVDLGDDIRIELGDGATLNALVNVPFDSLTLVLWSPRDSSECPDCLSQVVFPVMTTTFTVKVTGNNGCSDQDTLRVLVDRRKDIYVPNVFTPNGDGWNDVFTLFPKPNTVEIIQSFSIFSRWGELVYQYHNFLPNDPVFGWDGMYRGQTLNPAVFAWYAVVKFKDGEIKLFKGDVTLVR